MDDLDDGDDELIDFSSLGLVVFLLHDSNTDKFLYNYHNSIMMKRPNIFYYIHMNLNYMDK